jgi:hypothetical protein
MWFLVSCNRIRGLDAFLRGDSSVDLSFSLEYIWGCLESVAQALALYGRIPSCPWLRYSRAAVEPWSRDSFRSLEVYIGVGARYPFIWEYPSTDPLPARLGRIFLGGEARSAW